MLLAVVASTLTTFCMQDDPGRPLMSFSGDPTLPWEQDKPEEPWNKNAFNYILPAFEIAAFEVLLNLFDRNVIAPQDYSVNAETIRANLHHHWVLDNDPFSTNMLQHPYSGAIFYGFARSA